MRKSRRHYYNLHLTLHKLKILNDKDEKKTQTLYSYTFLHHRRRELKVKSITHSKEEPFVRTMKDSDKIKELEEIPASKKD